MRSAGASPLCLYLHSVSGLGHRPSSRSPGLWPEPGNAKSFPLLPARLHLSCPPKSLEGEEELGHLPGLPRLFPQAPAAGLLQLQHLLAYPLGVQIASPSWSVFSKQQNRDSLNIRWSLQPLKAGVFLGLHAAPWLMVSYALTQFPSTSPTEAGLHSWFMQARPGKWPVTSSRSPWTCD